MKSMKSMLAAGVLLASLCACKQAKEVTILSYNVHNCIGLDKVRDYERIARVINEAAPDVVAVQELDSATERNGGVYALAELEKLTGMNGIFASAISFQGGKLRHRTVGQGAAVEVQDSADAGSGRGTCPDCG